ncbi:MAG: CARDB domain-containing protein, partial [Tepidisphaerales bacterium]
VTTLAAADWSRDGTDHLVIGTSKPDGTGAITIDGVGSVSQASVPTSLSVGDLNNDGYPDILATASGGPGGTYVATIINNGSGGIAQTSGIGYVAAAAAIGDVNGDGINDWVMLVPDSGDGQAHVLTALGDGKGFVTTSVDSNLGNGSFTAGSVLALADLNGDGRMDLLAVRGPNASANGDSITVAYGQPDGTFANPVDLPATGVTALAVGDLSSTGGPSGRPGVVAVSAAYDAKNVAGGSTLSAYAGRGNLQLQLLDASGKVLAVGGGPADNAAAAIQAFVAPAAGTYYLKVTGDAGTNYTAAVTEDKLLALQPDQFENRPQDITGAAGVIGYLDNYLGNIPENTFAIQLNAGDQLSLATDTPSDPLLNTNIRLYMTLAVVDPNGNTIANALFNAPDSWDAKLTYAVPAGAGGSYSIVVGAWGGKGDYGLSVSGATGAPPALTVSTPADQTFQHVVGGFPNPLHVFFSQPVLQTSLSASDLLFDGQPATGVGFVSDTEAVFDVSTYNQGETTYTVSMAAGSVTSLEGVPLTAYSSTLTVDNGPRVATSTVQPDDTLAPGSQTFTFGFSKPILTFLGLGISGSIILDPRDVVLTDFTTGQSFQATTFLETGTDSFSSPTNPNVTFSTATGLTIAYQSLPEGRYQLRLISGSNSFCDTNFIGLDGSPSFPLPSGDGVPGDDFVVNFNVHQLAPQTLPIPSPLSPLGSQAFQGAPVTGAIFNGNADDYTLAVNAGQQISALLNFTYGDVGAQPQLQLLAPGGAVLATASAASGVSAALLQDFTAPTTGTYTLRVTSLTGNAAYTLQAQLNAAAQAAFGITPSNNSAASAQPLDFSGTDTGGATRADVTGSSDGTTPNYYSVTLAAGQRLSVGMTVTGGAAQPNDVLELVDSTDTVLAVGTPQAGSPGSWYFIQDFAAAAAGTYFVRVTPAGSYNVVAAASASLEIEPNDFPANTPQDISATDRVMGYIATAGDDDSYTFNASAGDALAIKTTTPGDGGVAEPNNGLFTALRLYAPDGTLLQANQGSNPQDAHDAMITYTVPSVGAGTYRVSVESVSNTTGTYVLSIAGATAAPTVSAPTVVSLTPAAGGAVAHAPATINVVLSEAIDPASVSTADLLIDGGSAVTGAHLIDGRTIQFTVTIPDVTATYNLSIPAGSIKSLSAQPIGAYSTTLSVDHVGPRVISQSPVTQGAAPFTSWTFTFSEPIDPASFPYYKIDSFTGPGGANVYFNITNVVVSGNTATVNFQPLTVQGTYTMVLDQSITDLVGNPMDQNQNGVNGQNPQDRYTATLSLVSPDLTVTSVVPASGAVFGSPLSVTWTVQNTGSDSANDGWTDQVYLCNSPVLDGSQTKLGTFSSPAGPLAAGASYTTTQTVNLPLNDSVQPGNQYIIVVTNANHHQAETDTTNDTSAAQTNIALPPLPDLAVSNVSGPPELLAGGTAIVNWTLSNVGNGDFNGTFVEAVFFSTHADGSNPTVLTYLNFAGSLAAGASVAGTSAVTVPLGSSGTYYFGVHADAFNQVFEHAQKANNTAVAAAPSLATLSAAPDFVSPGMTIPTGTVLSGQPLTITWTLTNQGTANFDGTFHETVLLSPNPDGSGADNGTTIAFSGPLAIGQTVQQSATIDIPVTYFGDRYVVITVNSSADVFENPLGQANNTTISATPIHLVEAPLPDLTVSSITAPAAALSNGNIPITWVDQNLGPAAANGSWYDFVYLSSDKNPADGSLAGQFPVTATIAAGASLTRTQDISLPATLNGTFYVIVVANGYGNLPEVSTANNTAASNSTLTVTLAPYPDLIVTSVTDPPTAFSGQNITVTWQVKNIGTGPTTTPLWYDQVYISPTPTFSTNDFPLGRAVNPSYLDVGQSYSTTATFTVPDSYAGTFYLIVQADVYNGVNEFGPGGKENNITAGGAVDIKLTPPPNLAVQSVLAPSGAFSGQAVSVSWQVGNTGPGATLAGDSSWFDGLYLSTTPSVTAASLRLGDFQHTGVLTAGQSYLNQALVALPVGISGQYYFVVVADEFQQVFENGLLLDNTRASSGTTVALTPPPDLAVTSITAPSSILAGHTLSVTYTVANEGSTATPNAYWLDSLYISTKPTLDNTATLIGSQRYPALLNPGDTYQGNVSGQLPYDISGNYYVFVQTNSDGTVFELDTTNNVASAPMSVTYAPPDLVVKSVSAPTALQSGAAVLASWTVANQGAGDTVNTSWLDQVYLSVDTVLGNSDDIFVGNFQHGTPQPLAAGGSYTASNQTIVIPGTVHSGSYYLFVLTNATQNVYEGPLNSPATLNDASAPLPVTVTQAVPDLQVASLAPVPTLAQGQNLALNWTVTNAGNATTGAYFWYDDIYLSNNAQFGGTLLARVQHSNPLGAGQSYTGSTTITIPQTQTLGAYYLLVLTDSLNNVAEPGPNGETNNLTASNSFSVVQGPAPDLAVTQVNPPATALSGQAISFSYTVTNQGNLPLFGAWYDTAYLSLDQTLTPGLDIALGSVLQTAGLAAGSSYTQNLSLQLPSGIAGPYYLFVTTDSSGRVSNDPNTANNTAYGATPVSIVLPAPTDIAVGTITLPDPAVGSLGLNMAITYTINNLSAQTAQGSWDDAIYLSTSNTFDATATLLGTTTHTGNVAPGGSYTATVTAPVPGLNPGNYYVIVRTDIRNVLPEAVKTNNIGASLNQVSLSLPTLTLGVPGTGSMKTGQSIYYQVVVPYGQTLYVTFNSDSATAVNELYLRYGEVPTRSAFDLAYSHPLQANQSITVPLTRAGTYYLLAYASAIPAALQEDYTLTATLPQFSVNDTGYGTGGTAGQLTIQVNGAKFDRTVTAALSGPGGTYAATKYYYVGSDRFYTTFDLTRVPPGVYDVTFTNSAAQTAVVHNGLNVVAGGGAIVQAGITAPNVAPHARNFSLTAAWGNSGIDDGPAPLLVITTSGAIGRDPAYLTNNAYTFFAPAPGDGPAGILMPGEEGSQVFFSAQPGAGGIWYYLGKFGLDPTLPFDFTSLYSELIPPGVTDQQFAPIFQRMQQDVGTTDGQVLTALAQDADLYPSSGLDNQIESNLLQVNIDRATAELNTSITGVLSAPDISVNIGGVYVTAINTATDQQFITRSYNDGSFVFPTLTAGTYSFQVDGALVATGNGVALSAGQHLAGVTIGLTAGESFSGTVRDLGTGLGVPNAQVFAVAGTPGDTSNISVVTDALGNYAFEGLPDGTYSLYTQADGYARAYQTFTPVAGSNPPDFELVPQATLTGTVTPPAGDNAPIQIFAQLAGQPGTPGMFTPTTINNTYTFNNLPAGTYTVDVQQLGAVTEEQTVTLAAGQSQDLGNVTLLPAASISGAVSSIDPSLSLAGLSVQLYAAGKLVTFAAADSTGAFRIDGLPSGTYTLEALLPPGLGIASSAPVTLSVGQQLAGVQLAILAGDALGGIVKLTGANTPLLGVGVRIVGADGTTATTSTDTTGHYLFNHLAPGAYTVWAAGAPATSVVLAAPDGSTTTQDLVVSAAVAGTISGHLTVNGTPATGFVTLFQGSDALAVVATDSAGFYSIQLTVAGSYALTAFAMGASFAPAAVSVAPGAAVTQDFAAGANSLAITVTDAIEAVTTDSVEIQQATPYGLQELSATSPDANGKVSASGLVPGTYQITVVTLSGATAQTTVTITDGQPANAALTVTAGDAISGTVADGSGPVNGAAVVAYAVGAGGAVTVAASAATDATGAYSIKGLPDGTYDLVFLAAGDQTFVVSGVVVTSAGLSNNAILGAATSHLNGRALDASGHPVPNTTIVVTDAVGHVLGTATTAADGTFTVDGVWGNNLTVRFSAAGLAPVTRTGVAAPSTGTTGLGDVQLVQVAFSGLTGGAAAGSAAFPTQTSPSQANPALQGVAVHPSFDIPTSITPTGELAALVNALQELGLPARDLNEAKLSDAPLLDECKTCAGKLAEFYGSVRTQDVARELMLDRYENALVLLKDAPLTVVKNMAEVTVFATGIVLAVDSLLAFLGAEGVGLITLGEGGATGLQVSIAGTTAGTLIPTGAAFVLANNVGGILGATYAMYKFMRGIMGDPNFDNVINDMNQVAAQSAGIGTYIGNIMNQLGQIKKLFPTDHVAGLGGGAGALTTLFQTFFDRQNVARTINFNDSIEALESLQDGINEYKLAKQRYQKTVQLAQRKLHEYSVCVIRASKTICHGHGALSNAQIAARFVQFSYSADPNDITGPTAFGPDNFVATRQPLNYQIDVQNEATATAPVQVLSITQALDPNLDVRTFRLGTMVLGNDAITPPPNVAFYSTRVDLTASLGIDVDVFAGINVATHQAFWTFTAIDPATGERPVNPLLGFLPPDVTPPNGEGYVTYTVAPVAGAPTGTVVPAQATVVFDTNAPIDTPTITDTLDRGAPTSSVAPLQAGSAPGGINLTWSGADDSLGSGIASFTIYASIDGGPFAAWLVDATTTSAVYPGTPGHTYAFYSVATDNVGNVQPTPGAAQATTSVSGPQATLTNLPTALTSTYGTPTLTLSGDIGAGAALPQAGETINVTLQNLTVPAIVDATGHFSATFDISALPASATPYAVTYSYGGDTQLGSSSDTTTTTLTVNPAPLTVTVKDASKGYGAPDPTFSAMLTGFVRSESITSLGGLLVLNTNEPAGNAPVGTYAISAAGLSSGNYAITFVPGVLTVSQQPLTITAVDGSKALGQPMPSLAVMYSGFIAGESAASLTTLPSLLTAATASSDAGSYPIGVSGAVDPNYRISYVPGTFVITQASPTVTLAPAPPTITYDGTNSVTAWAVATLQGAGGVAPSPTGSPSVSFYSGPSATGTALLAPPVNPGTYTAIALYAGDKNYLSGRSNPVTFAILAAPITVSLPSVAHIAAGGLYSASGSFTNLGGSGWQATVDYGDGAGPQPLALNPDQTFGLSKTYAQAGLFTVTVTVTNSTGGSGSAGALVTTTGIAAEHIFYNNSFFDGNNPALNPADDAAIATDKQALLPGQTATFANYTSYSKGINGIMIDVVGLGNIPALAASDFLFAVGNTPDPTQWASAPSPATIAVRPGAGTNSSDRIEIIWADGAIARDWLQVTVLADVNTGLASPSVFYFGNAIGESGNSPTDAAVTAADALAARGRSSPAAVPVDNHWDYNRDGVISSADVQVAQQNLTAGNAILELLAAPLPATPTPGAAVSPPELFVPTARPADPPAVSPPAPVTIGT